MGQHEGTARREGHRLLVLLWLTLAAPVVAAADPSGSLTLLHTNDLQGSLQPEPYYDETERGGWARLLPVLWGEGAGSDSTLVVDAGNALGPAVLAQYDTARTAALLMARGGYAAGVPANHELDYGLDTLRARVRDLGFPLVAANLLGPGGQPVFERYRVVQRAGLRVGVIGVVSPSLPSLVNPSRIPGVTVGQPQAALRQALTELADSTDLCVVLAHMPEEEAVALARVSPGAAVFVCGGFARPQEKGAMAHLVELVNGVRLVTTPERGPCVGRLWLELEPAPVGWRVARARHALVPVDAQVAADSAADRQIEDLAARFRASAARLLGTAADTIADARELVSDLARTRLRAEVGMVNAGALRQHGFTGRITQGDVDELVRYDDVLVTVRLTGQQLRDMAASSRSRARPGQHLVFSGFDPQRERVNGRSLVADETYRVATTGYLASGGDGYLSAPQQRRHDGWITLKEALLQHVQSHPGLTRWSGLRRGGEGAWKMRLKASGSLARTARNTSAGRYTGVAFLAGEESMAWNSLVDELLAYEAPSATMSLRVRSSFGQVMSNGRFREAADRLEGEALFSLQPQQRAPFVSLNAGSVWTRPSGQERPLALRGSSGLQLSRGQGLKARFGLGVERDQAAGTNTVGLEVVPEARRALRGGSSLSSTTKLFWGATEHGKVAVQQYNSALVNLSGSLYVTVDANLFLQRDTRVRATGLRTEVQVGLGYAWNRKWP